MKTLSITAGAVVILANLAKFFVPLFHDAILQFLFERASTDDRGIFEAAGRWSTALIRSLSLIELGALLILAIAIALAARTPTRRALAWMSAAFAFLAATVLCAWLFYTPDDPGNVDVQVASLVTVWALIVARTLFGLCFGLLLLTLSCAGKSAAATASLLAAVAVMLQSAALVASSVISEFAAFMNLIYASAAIAGVCLGVLLIVVVASRSADTAMTKP